MTELRTLMEAHFTAMVGWSSTAMDFHSRDPEVYLRRRLEYVVRAARAAVRRPVLSLTELIQVAEIMREILDTLCRLYPNTHELKVLVQRVSMARYDMEKDWYFRF